MDRAWQQTTSDNGSISNEDNRYATGASSIYVSITQKNWHIIMILFLLEEYT